MSHLLSLNLIFTGLYKNTPPLTHTKLFRGSPGVCAIPLSSTSGHVREHAGASNVAAFIKLTLLQTWFYARKNTIINQIIRFGTFSLHECDNGPNLLSASHYSASWWLHILIWLGPFQSNSSVSLSWALSWSWNYWEAINADAAMTSTFRAKLPQGEHGDGAITSSISPGASPFWAPGKASADLCRS